jgi:hypothetical protein
VAKKRSRPVERAQKGKDGKRPRHFHRGRAQGVRNDRLLRETLEPAFQAAAEDQDVVAAMSRSHRREQAGYDELWTQFERVSPFRWAPLPERLLV